MYNQRLPLLGPPTAVKISWEAATCTAGRLDEVASNLVATLSPQQVLSFLMVFLCSCAPAVLPAAAHECCISCIPIHPGLGLPIHHVNDPYLFRGPVDPRLPFSPPPSPRPWGPSYNSL